MTKLFALFVAFSSLVGIPAHALDCRSECDPGGAGCLLIKNNIPDAEVQCGLAWLFGMLSKGSDVTISRSELLKNFAMSTDPCHRSDTQVGSTGQISNVGDECKVGGAMILPDGPFSAYVLVPHELKLNFQLAGPLIEIVPEKGPTGAQRSQPVALFSDESFQEDFGGTIEKLWFSEKYSILQTRACIRFNY